MNPLVDYTTKSTEELLELNKKYTQRLYSLNGDNPLYTYILNLRDQVQAEYHERMQMQIHKEKLKKDKEQIIEIGEIQSETILLDNATEEEKLLKAVANLYTDKKDDKNS